MIGAIITTYNRPKALERTARQVAALRLETLVVDDGSRIPDRFENEEIAKRHRFFYLALPKNRGLAAALNMGLAFWLADSRADWISYFQDDVDVHPETINILQQYHALTPFLTGHDAVEHAALKITTMEGRRVKIKQSCRATHMHAAAYFWRSIMPIPTNALGTPKRTQPGVKGMGSNVDWWIVRDAPQSVQRQGKGILCIPNLVRSFLWRAQDSCWYNTAPGGEEPPLLGAQT